MSDTKNSPAGGFTLPLTLLDEAILHLQEARSQWNVQFELSVNHQVDEAKMQEAVLAGCQRHPLTRARLAPWKQLGSSYRWDIGGELDIDPVRLVECFEDAALNLVRSELYGQPIELDVTPPLRLVIARQASHDRILLSISHLIADGAGALRLMQTIGRAYRGEPDPEDPIPLADARNLGSLLTPQNRSEKWARHLEGWRRLREALDAPSRIATVGGSNRDGFGFVYRAIEVSPTTAPALVQRAPGTTVNDVLLAALHLTIQAWNTAHDVTTDRVGIMMPVNIRPADRFWDTVSNITSMVTVSTDPDDRKDLTTASAAVATQTEKVRRKDRAYGLYDILKATNKAPLALKRAAPRLLPYTGDRFVDTAMLSNLGRIPEAPNFAVEADAQEPELWFSPPCDPTCSVAIGVVTVKDRLSLVTRYRYEQFNASTAAEFTDLLIDHLSNEIKHHS